MIQKKIMRPETGVMIIATYSIFCAITMPTSDDKIYKSTGQIHIVTINSIMIEIVAHNYEVENNPEETENQVEQSKVTSSLAGR